VAESATLPAVLASLEETDRRLLRKCSMPDWTPPMLATLVKQPFSDPAWIFETKLDGQRSLLFRSDGRSDDRIRLMTRNQKDRTAHYPELERAARPAISTDLIADGEIVAFDGERTSFSRLQDRMQNARPSAAQVAAVPVFYYLFDLLFVEGYDLRALPLSSRKRVLRAAIDFRDPIRFSEHLDEDGELAFRAACERGWEGLIAKRAASPYVGARSRDWLKFKCSMEQEFVVIGWTDPKGSRTGIGALLVGYYEDGDLRFAGKVGTGFDRRELDRLAAKLAPLERATPALAEAKGIARPGVHWVRPQIVAQVGFSEWTPEGKLRHPRYLGLRDDKTAGEVARER
jgi:bifunctional non-homologous end joining protein LigD